MILQAAKQDYDRFFADEIKSRKLGLYPPFCTLCQVGFSGENEDFVRASAQWVWPPAFGKRRQRSTRNCRFG